MAFVVSEHIFQCIFPCIVTPQLRKGAQWRKVASRGDGTTTAELVCQAEGIPAVEFTWEKKGMVIDLANPRLGIDLVFFS